MSETENITECFAKLDNHSSKAIASNDPVAYQNLSVVKKIAKAKFSIYLALSNVNKQYYAMKIFPHIREKPHACYKNEARFASLKHPNVIDMIYCEDERVTLDKNEVVKVSYILMEYAPYGDFFHFIAKYGSEFDDKLVRTLFRQLIDGIEYLHSRGVAHLDLKPENLLIGADFNLKIADFDLSHVEGDEKIVSKGTKYYRGPEFFKSSSSGSGVKIPFAADIYSAGIILFILKCGGVYPHSESSAVEGINMFDLLYNENKDFWIKHCEIQSKKSSFFDKDFKELFNAMTKYNPAERISINEIKHSKWYKGSVYSQSSFQKKMKKIIKG